jgi:hypothetical protein
MSGCVASPAICFHSHVPSSRTARHRNHSANPKGTIAKESNTSRHIQAHPIFQQPSNGTLLFLLEFFLPFPRPLPTTVCLRFISFFLYVSSPLWSSSFHTLFVMELFSLVQFSAIVVSCTIRSNVRHMTRPEMSCESQRTKIANKANCRSFWSKSDDE